MDAKIRKVRLDLIEINSIVALIAKRNRDDYLNEKLDILYDKIEAVKDGLGAEETGN